MFLNLKLFLYFMSIIQISDFKNAVCHKAAHMYPKYINYSNWRYHYEMYLRFNIILISRYD